ERLAPNLRVLLESSPVELEDVVIFPCPLLRRHESSDPTTWLRDIDEAALKDFNDKPRVLLAHGSIQGFDSSGDDEGGAGGAPNLINLEHLPMDSFDYVALGDWHGTKQVGDKAWYSGTPEIDRFPKGGTNEPGNVLLVSIERGGSPLVEAIRSNNLGWHQLNFEFASDEDLDALDKAITDLIGNRASSDLLRLSLRGSLGLEATTGLESLLDSLNARLLRLKLDNQTLLAPTEEEIEALTQRSEDPLIARVATKLVELADGPEEDAVVARVALRELHAVCANP
ncbi:MAG: DNA repair exonuclease, partial [Verrucomicrobia bacterium]|nr:DNA repair exonuclease [Verrucomicrobiota bacterium]